MAVDDQGRLYVSGQKNMGLYRMTLNPDTEQFSIVKMPLELKGTRGMVWHKNSLYYYFKNDVKIFPEPEIDTLPKDMWIKPSG